jgi:hypothetical protein
LGGYVRWNGMWYDVKHLAMALDYLDLERDLFSHVVYYCLDTEFHTNRPLRQTNKQLNRHNATNIWRRPSTGISYADLSVPGP